MPHFLPIDPIGKVDHKRVFLKTEARIPAYT